MTDVRALQLRQNATDAENRLWYALKNRGLGGHKFIRQFPIGPYIADFVCRQEMLIVELDGGQHEQSSHDVTRSAYLNAQGYSVLRFWNNEALQNRDGVLQTILEALGQTPSPDLRYAPATLSPTGRGTRGARAAAASARSRMARPVSSTGEGLDRPRGESAIDSERRTP